MDWGVRTRISMHKTKFLILLIILACFACFVLKDYQWKSYQNEIHNSVFTIDLVPSDVNSSEVHQPSRKLNFLEESRVLKDIDYVQSREKLDDNRPEIRYSSDHDINEQKIRRLPQAIICGVKKGGTRALLEMLRLHPDVVAPGPEVHFFDTNYHLGIDWYRKKMPPSWPHQLTMEKTPSYFTQPSLIERVFNMSRKVRFLVVVRDPVSRAVSDYTDNRLFAHNPEAKEKVLNFSQIAFTKKGEVKATPKMIAKGAYSNFLEMWLKFYPKSHFLFVSGERLAHDPFDEIIAVQAFLGLRPIVDSNSFLFDPDKGFFCLRKTPRHVRCLGGTKGLPHVVNLTSTEEQKLRDFYRPLNRKFYGMVHRDFGWK